MSPFRYFALLARRRQLRKINEWVRMLEDQVASGERSLHYWRERQRRLEAQVYALESPDDIVRRARAA